MAKWLNGTVVDNYRWNDRLTSLKFEAPLGEFKPGQFVRVGLEIDGEIIARPYSLVNTPSDSILEIYFNIVPEGPLTPPLFKLQKPRPPGVVRDQWLRVPTVRRQRGYNSGIRMTNVKIQSPNECQIPKHLKTKNYHEKGKEGKHEKRRLSKC